MSEESSLGILVSTRACDACYIRKVKCEPLDTARGGDNLGRSTQCKQCRALRMQCAFERPQRRRPRKFKAAALRSGDDKTPPVRHAPSISDPGEQETLSINTPTSMSTFFDHGTPYSSIGSASTSSPILLRAVPTSSATDSQHFGVHKVGSQEVFDLMIKDYLDVLYPLLQIVHRPSFKADIANNRAESDPVFYSMLLSICGVVISQLPRRFLDYKKAQWFFDFETPKGAVTHLESTILQLRPHDYFEESTIEKCTISYFLACTYGNLNILGRMSMYWSEMWVLLKGLGAHHPESYHGLDFVETQLRKKAFWLHAIYAGHERVNGAQLRGAPLWNPMPDNMLFDSKHLEALIPFNLDDEYIQPNKLCEQPSSDVSLASGFISLIKIYTCFMDLPEELPDLSKSNMGPIGNASDSWIRRSDDQVRVMQNMFERARYVLDDVAPRLAPWRRESSQPTSPDEYLDSDVRTRYDQLESIRANLHVSRLWVRSLIFERLITLNKQRKHSEVELDNESIASRDAADRAHWSEREDTCEQLLHILYNIKQKNLEPNGTSLTFKIRQVAAPLLDCPFEEHTSISRRARLYIEKFMELLTLLDKYSFQDTQIVVWNDFEHQQRQPVSDFMQLS